MKIILRWFESADAVDLGYLRQIPCVQGVASELVKPVGVVWPLNELERLRDMIQSHGLSFEVVESVKVHEDIKLGDKKTRDYYIANYSETLRNLGIIGVKVVCYDFMPIFDWFRTDTNRRLEDGSISLLYDQDVISKMNPLTDTIEMSDWENHYSKEELADLFKKFSLITEDDMWNNLDYFLKQIIPVAEESGIKMALHPDDPCWPIFGLPRIITSEKSLDRVLSLVDSPSNSLTLCSGSLGCNSENDLVHIVKKYSEMGKVAFGHIRNVKNFGNGSFCEVSHNQKSGSLDIVGIVKAYEENAPDVYIRPDHGRMIWGEKGAAGYGLYDRALGATYIAGIADAL